MVAGGVSELAFDKLRPAGKYVSAAHGGLLAP